MQEYANQVLWLNVQQWKKFLNFQKNTPRINKTKTNLPLVFYIVHKNVHFCL